MPSLSSLELFKSLLARLLEVLPNKHHHIRHLALGRNLHKIGFAKRVLEQKRLFVSLKVRMPFARYTSLATGYQSFEFHTVYRMAEIVCRTLHDHENREHDHES